MESNEIIVPQMPYMEAIFRRLKTNAFINEETFSVQERLWYNQIHENFSAYHQYLAQLGYRLESGPGYFHLSEPKPAANIVSMLRNNIGEYIKMLTVLTEYRPELEPGAQFKVHDLLSFCDDNDEVKALLPSSNDGLLAGRVSAYLKWVSAEGFLAISSDETTVMVTSAFRYLKEFILRIRLYGDYAKFNLPDDDKKTATEATPVTDNNVAETEPSITSEGVEFPDDTVHDDTFGTYVDDVDLPDSDINE